MLEVIIAILILLAIYILITYNRLIKQQLKVKQSKSGIDVYLQQRFDLIPNLVTCVKKYCEYEKELLKEIAELRTVYATNKNLDTGKELNEKISSLLAVAENYPDLKADEQFLNLQGRGQVHSPHKQLFAWSAGKEHLLLQFGLILQFLLHL